MTHLEIRFVLKVDDSVGKHDRWWCCRDGYSVRGGNWLEISQLHLRTVVSFWNYGNTFSPRRFDEPKQNITKMLGPHRFCSSSNGTVAFVIDLSIKWFAKRLLTNGSLLALLYIFLSQQVLCFWFNYFSWLPSNTRPFKEADLISLSLTFAIWRVEGGSFISNNCK